MTMGYCLLGTLNRKDPCKGICRTCGWDSAEAKRRIEIIRRDGLGEDRWGCRRLMLRRDDEPEAS